MPLDKPTILSLPPEILQQTFSYLDRKTWHNLTLVHRQLTPSALVLLYQEPHFFSSYRFAQFVTTVATSAAHAGLVRDLILKRDSANLVDLNGIFNDGISFEMLAGWREWKYRDSGVWGPLPAPQRRTWKHPLAALFSRRADKAKSTIPIGALIQVLTACVNLRSVYPPPIINRYDSVLSVYRKVDHYFPRRRKVCITGLRLSTDWEILNTEPPYPVTNRLFISDVPRAARPHNPNDRRLQMDDCVRPIHKLQHLETLHLTSLETLYLTDPSELGDGNLIDREALMAVCPKLTDFEVQYSSSG